MNGIIGLTDTEQWMAEGTCAPFPELADLFFSNTALDRRVARQMCSVCPVRTECMDYGNRHGLEGIFGGYTEFERKQMQEAA